MKKMTGILAVLLAALMLLTTFASSVAAAQLLVEAEPAVLTDDSAYNYLPGDINNDGFITSDDARVALRLSVGLESWETVARNCNYSYFYDYRAASDPDGDGYVTAADARLILRIAVGLDPVRAGKESALSTKQNIIDFYTASVNAIKYGGVAGYDRKSFQKIESFDIVSVGNSTFQNAVTEYLTLEADAQAVCYKKGSNAARNYFPTFTVNSYSLVKSAVCTVNTKGNYVISLTMLDADTTKSNNGSFLYCLTDDAITWDEHVAPALDDMFIVKDWDNPSIVTKDFTITAEITPDGRFLSISHIGYANISVDKLYMTLNPLIPYENKTAVIKTTSTFTNFNYSHCYYGNRCGYVPAAFGSISAIADYLGKCTLEISNKARAGYTKVAYQTFAENDGYNLTVCTKSKLNNYITSKTDATPVTTVKGSTESWALFPPFLLKRFDNIEGATCAVNAKGNYVISIVFKDIETTKASVYNDLQLVTTSLINAEHVSDALRDMSNITSHNGVSVVYEDFTITAEVTPDGRFISYTQTAKVRCSVKSASFVLVNHKDQYAVLNSVQEFTNFTY